MAEYFDYDDNYDPITVLRNASAPEKKRLMQRYREMGWISPDPDRGIMTEIGHTIIDTGNRMGASMGRTIEELTGNSNMRERYEYEIRNNPQYGADAFYSPSSLKPSHIARTVTTGAVQSVGAIGAGMAGNLVAGPAGGFAAMSAFTFGQIYGDTVKDYREAMPDEDESVVKGLAFISATGQSLIESVLGPEKVVAGLGKGFFAGTMKETTRSLARRIGAEALKGALSEGGEEVMQAYWDALCKGVAAKEGLQLPGWEEVRDQFMGGAMPGLVLGGIGGVRSDANANAGNGANTGNTKNTKNTGNGAGTEVTGGAAEGNGAEGEVAERAGVVPGAGIDIEGAPRTDQPIPVSDAAILRGGGRSAGEALLDELGIKHSRMTEEEQQTEGIGYVMQDGERREVNGLFDRNTNEIKINPNNEGEMFTHGHELDHWLTKNHSDLAEQLHKIIDAELNEAGLAENESPEERRADMLGQILNDPEALRRAIDLAGKQDAGFGEKFLKAVIEFSKQVMAYMKSHAHLPGAEQYFNDYKKVRDTAASILAEVKRRNGTSTTEENTVGVNGNSAVQSIPLNELEIDPARFQFKSKADKTTGVDESNLIGGEWDPKTAGNLYVWEDKNGRKFVVNGHHRYHLAKQAGAEKVNVIVDREADGVSAEQARRNGVLINIRDGQGEISDYADFVRKEKLDEETADKEGVLAREKGRTGYLIGRYASDNLYQQFKSGEIGAKKAAVIADMARGDEALEAAGIKGARENMGAEHLKQYLELLKNTPRQEKMSEGDLFGFNDSALKTAEALSKQALKHIREVKEKIIAARSVVKNPAAAKKLGVSVGKDAQALLDKAIQEAARWEHWATDPELYARLRREIGIGEDARTETDVTDITDKTDERGSSFAEATEDKQAEAGTTGNTTNTGNTGENARTEAETRDQKDAGRFNQDSDVPLLSAEEDAGDFQLFSETPQEAQKRDQAAEKAEADKLERAKEEARRNAPELPMKDAGADAANTNGENGENGGNGKRGYTSAEEAEVYAELKKLEETDPEKPQFRLPSDKTVDELIREDITYRLREKRRMPEITPEKSVWLSHLRYLKSMTKEEIAHHNGVVNEDLNSEEYADYREGTWTNSDATRTDTGHEANGANGANGTGAVKEDLNGWTDKTDERGEQGNRNGIDRKIEKDVSKLKVGDHAAFGKSKQHPEVYSGEVVSIGKKNVKLKTQSKMYGEQILTLPMSEYLAHYPKNTVVLNAKQLEKYKNEHGGHTPEEVDAAKISFMDQHLRKSEDREITSGTYESAQKRMRKDVENFVGGKKPDVQYSLCAFEDGRRFVDVKADQHLFDGLSSDEARTLAKKIIKERFVGKVIGIDNPVFVNGRSAGEYAYPAKPISKQDIKQAKMRASSELDNLIDAGIPLPDQKDGADGHVHSGAEWFSYLETIFKVGNEFYRGIVNIVNNGRGRLLKDITKIENITKATSDSYGANPKFRNLRDVSMQNVAQSGEMSNPGIEKKSKKEVNTDAEYLDAVKRGDMKSARQMVLDAAKRAGYNLPGEQGQFRDGHAAPGDTGIDFDNITPEEYAEDGGDVNLVRIVEGFSPQPDDYFDDARGYMYDVPAGLEAQRNLKRVMQEIKNGNKNAEITVYRAVPYGVNVSRLQNGDWVSPSRKYVVDHGESRFGKGQYRIVEEKIPAAHLWWDGNDIREWGYDNGKEEATANVIGNRKSLDAVTYDDQGNIIPLSERFNQDNPDYQYSIAGERGLANLSRESKEGLRRLEDLQSAKNMLADGRDMKSIKMMTGWELGKDGKWKTELPDLKVKRFGVLPDGNEYEKDAGEISWFNGKLGEYVDAPEIFKAYPDMRNISLHVQERPDNKIYAEFAKDINPRFGEEDGRINVYLPQDLTNADSAAKLVEELLTHEVQHAIQDIEGFAPGASPGYYQMNPAYTNEGKAAIRDASEKLKAVREKFHQKWGKDAWQYLNMADRYVQQYSHMLDEGADWKGMEESMKDIADIFREKNAYDLLEDYRREFFKKQAAENSVSKKIPAFTAYRRTAGEVEARNAAARRNIPLEERLRRLLAETEDVAEEEKIYLDKAVGEAMSQATDRTDQTDLTDRTDPASKTDKDYSLRKHRQVNPIVVNGQVQSEYADLLNDREYTPETIRQWQDKAIDWIERHGGVVSAAELIADDTEHSERHVATLARRMVLNSDMAEEIPAEIREKIELKNIEDGTKWGREGAARRLAALTLSNMDRVRALFQKLHESMPEAELQELRNSILDKTGIDIFNLPDDLVDNKDKLDQVLREELAARSNWGDKAYEYWINAILSAPTTHASNIIGNTVNALYELGAKRFAEAAINAIAKRKDAATFGEFREMWKAFDLKNAWAKAKEAFDREILTPEGKFREGAALAISGKTGRVIRMPGRLLVMADAFARELLIPMETASRAFREGQAKGLKGAELQKHVRESLSNPASSAYQEGKASAEQIIFQEQPGAVLEHLISLKNQNTPGGWILKYMLPFVKTPGNILRQGIRKSPLGVLNLSYETVQAVRGKQQIDSEYLGHAAEQLIAWAAFLALGGFDDDDDDEGKPFLTGSSAAYGSGEANFKANEVPPYSIRIGDTYYSYKRIEPLATGLAAIADAHQALREMRNGKSASAALSDMLKKQGRVITEKSYLDSINQMVRFMEDPERSVANFGTNFISSWVPNAVRSALHAAEDEVEDTKSREQGEAFWKDQFHIITSKAGFTQRVPKVDLFGHEIKKEEAEETGGAGDFLWRLMVPVNRRVLDEDHPGKRLIWNYNTTHPEEQWWPSLPNWKFTRNKEKYYFDNEAYHDFAVEAGQLAEKQMLNAVRHGLLQVENPTEKDIELMKKIFARARKEVRERMMDAAKPLKDAN